VIKLCCFNLKPCLKAVWFILIYWVESSSVKGIEDPQIDRAAAHLRWLYLPMLHGIPQVCPILYNLTCVVLGCSLHLTLWYHLNYVGLIIPLH
jgi:hypothetical protein